MFFFLLSIFKSVPKIVLISSANNHLGRYLPLTRKYHSPILLLSKGKFLFSKENKVFCSGLSKLAPFLKM